MISALGSATARWKHFDWLMLAATLLLSGFGLLMIYSATGQPGSFHPTIFVYKQAMYLVVGLVGMMILASVDYRFLQNWTWWMYSGILGLLALIFVLGKSAYGSTRWIDLGPFPLQPSELAKLLLVLVLAKFLSDRPRGQSPLFRFVVSLVLVAVPLGLIFLQPDLGTSMVVGAVWLALTITSGTKRKYLMWLAILSLPLGFVAWRFVLKPYQVARVLVFLDPYNSPLDDGYNIIQASISVGAGGLFGRGFLGGSQSQLHYLRVEHTDFIASVIGEEFGFIGMAALLLVYGLLLWRILRAGRLSRDRYGELITIGVTAVLLFQIFVNIGMNVQLMPVTGIPLPFISYGGSSLVTLLAAQGIVQSILMRQKQLST